MLAPSPGKHRSWEIVPKTPSGLHFELTDQKLSANHTPPSPIHPVVSTEVPISPTHPLFLYPSLPPPASSSPLLSWQIWGINGLAYWCAFAWRLSCTRSATHAFMHQSSGMASLSSGCLSHLKRSKVREEAAAPIRTRGLGWQTFDSCCSHGCLRFCGLGRWNHPTNCSSDLKSTLHRLLLRGT